MALLAATQGTPERIWSLLTILSAHEGVMERVALSGWLNPRFTTAGETAREEKTAVDQTIQAANGLALIDSSEKQIVRLLISGMPEDYSAFSDLVHERLVSKSADEADAVLLEAFAWQVVQVELEGSTQWIDEWTAEHFAAAASAALTPVGWTGERRFNATKRAPWRRWMDLVGLSTTLPSGHSYPYVTPRLERVLCQGIVPLESEIAASEFMAAMSTHLPYLDGGKLFKAYAARLKLTMQPRAVTQVLSSALRELVEDKVISLKVRGDSAENYSLAPDLFSRLRSFGGVIVHGR